MSRVAGPEGAEAIARLRTLHYSLLVVEAVANDLGALVCPTSAVSPGSHKSGTTKMERLISAVGDARAECAAMCADLDAGGTHTPPVDHIRAERVNKLYRMDRKRDGRSDSETP